MRSSEATINDLVYAPTWDIDSMVECCGARVLFRLGGQYITHEDFNSAGTFGTGFTAMGVRAITRTFTEDDFLDYVKYWSEAENAAMPIKVAYAAVLADLRDIEATLFFASDSTRVSGDVHLGPFSTKNFMQWMWEHNLADMGEVKIDGLVGWTFKIATPAANRVIAKYKNQYEKRNKRLLAMNPEWRMDDNNWRTYDW